MSHPLRRIRHWLVKGLIAAETTAESRIYGNRFRPVWDEDLPAIVVLTIEEEDSVFEHAPRRYKRTARVGIVLMVKATETREDDADDRLDDLAEQVEQFLFFDRTLGGIANDSRLADWKVEPMEAGRVLLAVGRLVLEVDYFQEAGEGGDVRGLDDLTHVHVRTKVGPEHTETSRQEIELERPL